MIKAKIENGKETQYLELPCEQETLNAKFGGGDGEIGFRPSTASAGSTRTCRRSIKATFRTP